MKRTHNCNCNLDKLKLVGKLPLPYPPLNPRTANPRSAPPLPLAKQMNRIVLNEIKLNVICVKNGYKLSII